MQTRTLGNSGVVVPPICFGTMLFGNPVREPEAERLVHAAIDQGINFIDTANSYEGYDRTPGSRGGVAEEYLGRVLKARRERVVLLTKIGSPVGPDPHDKGSSRGHLQRELEKSLQRLQTDRIDLLMLHWPDLTVPFEESLGTLDRFVKEGKVRYFGVSNFVAWQLCELLWLSDRLKLERLVAYQPPYSILRRDIEISELLFCRKFGIGITCYQVLQGGWLSGRHPGPTSGGAGRLVEKPQWLTPLPDSVWPRLESLSKIASRLNVSLAELAIAWTLRHREISSVVLGMRSLRNIESAISASELIIPADELQKIDDLFPLAMDLRWPWSQWRVRVSQ